MVSVDPFERLLGSVPKIAEPLTLFSRKMSSASHLPRC